MEKYIIEDCGCVKNARVYGLDESIRRAKFPMSASTDRLDDRITDGIKNLARAEKGSGHDNWLNGVVVQFDLTFSVKAWTEAERYHFFDIVSSQSTMHRITRFNLASQYDEHVDKRCIEIMKELVERYDQTGNPEDYLKCLMSNPCGMKLTAGMTTNYRQLKTIYSQRKSHRLPEWREFCEWIEKLPMAKELIV